MAPTGSSLLSVLVIASFVAGQPPFSPGHRRPPPGAGGLPPFPGSFVTGRLPPFSGSSSGGGPPQRPDSFGEGGGPTQRPGSLGESGGPTQRPDRFGEGGGSTQRPGSFGEGGGSTQRPGSFGEDGGPTQRPGSFEEGGGSTQRLGSTEEGGTQSSTVMPSEDLVKRTLAQAKEDSCSPEANSCNGNTCGSNLDPVFHMEEDGEWRILITNGIPNHTYGVGAERPNPNEVCVHNAYMKVPINATQGSFQQSGMGPVGIALSGAFFYNHLSEPNGDVAAEVEGPSFDSCSGYADSQCRYQYQMVPKCLDPDDACKLVGYMMDGFPVYSYCTVNGERLRSCYKQVSGDGTNQSDFEYSPDETCQLDEANGYDFGGSKGYGYVFSENYPFIMPGFKGSKVYSICGVN